MRATSKPISLLNRQAIARPPAILHPNHFSSSARHHAEIELEIDGKKVTVEQGSALIQACEKAGATIPRFCYHDRLAIAGNCRMCLVEIEKAPKPVASCAMPAMPGSKVFTNTPLVHKAREGVMEFLLANHPLDCPICDQGGECDLQDQSMRYGSDRSRFKEYTGKRAVENKNLGPIVKTVMTRCIQCTRCVRFANEVAGVDEFGTTGRGNDMQIGTYIERTLNSELSGNIIDLCPVGALTSKPYAFTARPWELKLTESIDVMDGLGSNIRIDSRGLQVMRIQPRINEDVNEEWIHDKTRYAYDGLKTQRLTTPLIKTDGKFQPATWAEALAAVAHGLKESGAKNNEIQAIAGALADTESMVALKDLINKLGSDNTALENASGDATPVHGVDFRQNYAFNSTIVGADEADFVLLVGTNPRHEAAVLNSRFRRSWLNKGLQVGLIGQKFNSVFEVDHLGVDLRAVKEFVSGTGKFAQAFKSAKKPMIIIGSAVNDHANGHEIFKSLAGFVEAHKAQFLTPEWNGFNVLQRTASSTAAYDIGFVPSNSASKARAKFIYLLNADDFDPSAIPKDAFVVYQGHHGDLGASYADVCLPGTAYTEKSATWVNTEGRSQLGRTAVSSPGSSREDWKIIRAVSEVMDVGLPYDDPVQLRNRMWEVCPSLVRYDELAPSSAALEAVHALASSLPPTRNPNAALKTGALGLPIKDFYFTDPISRASVTMAQCSKAFSNPNPDVTHSDKSDQPMAAFG
ncbi:hypothetical protein PCANC_05455 [Puccinia coronata f. sp. avenae]|uniref:NADH dehydrogenase (Quinone), G subunit n=1 Tax=Puccinia coronata f. sp. avenae TaxID=200324 RepID=A0A2N5V528_9BASI|nr:hypothetical protein PCASD_23278 [Puccinia coronata f. sp. avenae]PLW21141.1 hypothetical protein PCANC_05455 [Puccinia coronata f. sp. avenae]PLW25294.1 hypothetical protein PCASD_23154 [Puccinia coronata f. sp. avenae]PLW45095.1 hypothetical protein PCASD_04602 [Puccinia coronata f. sp. avenae]